MSNKPLSYKQAGVDIDEKNRTFDAVSEIVSKAQGRVLNRMGAYASLIDISFPECEEPILVFKIEEPGTKQKLALEYGSLNTVAHDMINHLVDDIIVMGAKPLAVQDLIVCGKLKSEVITPLIQSISEACNNNDCVLVGGETSEQPGVIQGDIHVLGASIIGIVDKKKIIDGSRIQVGDKVIAIASNGLHTNGYSLVRKLIEQNSDIVEEKVAGERFIDVVLRPHLSYNPLLQDLFKTDCFHGLAHITGGGIEGNLARIMPEGKCAQVDLSKLQVSEIFKFIKEKGSVPNEDMLRTFNMGVGITAIVSGEDKQILNQLNEGIYEAYEIGEIIEDSASKVKFCSELQI